MIRKNELLRLKDKYGQDIVCQYKGARPQSLTLYKCIIEFKMMV